MKSFVAKRQAPSAGRLETASASRAPREQEHDAPSPSALGFSFGRLPLFPRDDGPGSSDEARAPSRPAFHGP
ncbi:hypothetical protein ACLESO_50010, partial [Pyxidicoccus sp. 3LG]